jgi:hypothetical protein
MWAAIAIREVLAMTIGTLYCSLHVCAWGAQRRLTSEQLTLVLCGWVGLGAVCTMKDFGGRASLTGVSPLEIAHTLAVRTLVNIQLNSVVRAAQQDTFGHKGLHCRSSFNRKHHREALDLALAVSFFNLLRIAQPMQA